MRHRVNDVLYQRLFVFCGLFCVVFAAQAQQGQPPSITAVTPSSVVGERSNVDMVAQIKQRGKLRVGVSEVVPWAMHNKDGELIGFEIDVAKKIARDLGVKVELHPVQFRSLTPDLVADRFDIIISGFSIEVSRALLVNFSNPYDTTDVTLATNKRVASNLNTLDSVNQPGITVGVIEGMTSEDLAALAFPKASIHTYTEDGLLFNDLLQGKLSAAVADNPRLDILAKLYPDSISLPPIAPLGTFPAAFAVRRGDMDFVNYLNSWIAARTADKWLESRRAYWFKTTDWESTL